MICKGLVFCLFSGLGFRVSGICKGLGGMQGFRVQGLGFRDITGARGHHDRRPFGILGSLRRS